MFNIDRWQEIFDAIAKNKLRTFLTGVSVGSGIFILIILLGVANGFKKGTEKQFSRDAATLMHFWSGNTSKEYNGLNAGRSIKLTIDNYELIEKQYQEYIEYKSADYRRFGMTFNYKDKSGSYQFTGVMPDRQFLESADLVAGRFINQKDYDQKNKTIVIGTQVSETLFETHQQALGKRVQVNKIQFVVVGVFKDPNERENERVYLPHSTMLQLYHRERQGSSFLYTLHPEERYEDALAKSETFAAQVKAKLQKIHQVHPDDPTGIRYFNSVKNSKDLYQLIFGMKLFFWVVGILTLIAGIVGVGNIMLIIVKERTKEIGIRKALGAQPKAIVVMILHEAIFITSLSGVSGLFLGFLVLELIGKNLQTDFIYQPSVNFSIAISTVILLVIAGVIAGYFPAKYASKIKPIIALRDE
ncbi:ABC transporter permease [Ochrovirga pacifica]|uniref:ABC transporter permease n=1 Tax=Ochrovirga pacifica TaxID=1042376 RepID=UPI0002557B67|nr:ABC transporter permease [Ochrovirga pacifica]